MQQVVSWVSGACVGFVRACAVTVVSMLVPAVWAAAVVWGIQWGAANPWSWVGPLVLVCVSTLALSRPVCRSIRHLVAKWTATTVPAGYRQAAPVTQLSTGHWWNGRSYERTRRDALLDQRWRNRWTDPATWRDLRFTGIVPFTAGVVAAVPPAGVAVAVLGLGQSDLAPASSACSAWSWRSARPRTPGGPSCRWPPASCVPRPRCCWRTGWTS